MKVFHSKRAHLTSQRRSAKTLGSNFLSLKLDTPEKRSLTRTKACRLLFHLRKNKQLIRRMRSIGMMQRDLLKAIANLNCTPLTTRKVTRRSGTRVPTCLERSWSMSSECTYATDHPRRLVSSMMRMQVKTILRMRITRKLKKQPRK